MKGIIKVAKSFYIENYKKCIIEIFKMVIPMEIKYDLFTDRFIILGESDYFFFVKEGEVIPEYTAIFTVKKGVPEFQKFVKI